jgi:hypothetical protein
VKAQMMRKIDKFEVRADRSEFLITHGQKKSVAYGFPLGTCSLAGLHGLEFDSRHG